MRLGIISTQINLIIPPELPATGLMKYVVNHSHVDLIKKIVNSGFSLIELGGDLEILLPHLYTPKTIQELMELKLELGLKYTIHLPLWSVEPSTLLSPVREGSVQALINHINLVKPLMPEVYVLHATGAMAAEFYRMKLPDLAKKTILKEFNNCAKDSVSRILEETGIPKRKLAVETIEFPFEMTLNLANELDVSICFDTGHVLAGFSGPINFFDALEQCLPRLVEIHLHDSQRQCPEQTIPYGKDHQTLGNGDLDLATLLDRLTEASFSGPIIFELTIEQALESLNFIRDIRPGIINQL